MATTGTVYALGRRGVARGAEVLESHPRLVDAGDVVEIGALAVGAAVAGWLAAHTLLATLCALAAAGGARWRAGERWVARYGPAAVRRVLAASLGVTLGLGAAAGAHAVPGSAGAGGGLAPATAEQPSQPEQSVVPVDLGWIPTSAERGAATPHEAEPTGASPEPPPSPDTTATETVTVRPGDSLWAITAAHLPGTATTPEVAAAWPSLHEANSHVIGADPDLIRPGQVLTLPADLVESP